MSAVARFFEDVGQEAMAMLARCETAAEQFRCGGRALAGFYRQAEGLFVLFLEYWSQSEWWLPALVAVAIALSRSLFTMPWDSHPASTGQ
jgi:hypothetical protein